MTSGLAKIERVNLRSGWAKEDEDFTPWLAENIAELGDVLGLELEVKEIESPVGNGSRRLDIWATDNNNRSVVIENQLEYSDNDHLSRLLIYSSDKDADVVVWIAAEFWHEHWKVLRWLNQRTFKTKFFCVVVELLRIDNSRLAPHFQVVAAPDDWRKPDQSFNHRNNNEEFRVKLQEKLARGHGYTVPHDEQTKNSTWRVLETLDGIGHYSTDFHQNLRVNLVIGKRDGSTAEWNQHSLEQLKQHQTSIESVCSTLTQGSGLTGCHRVADDAALYRFTDVATSTTNRNRGMNTMIG